MRPRCYVGAMKYIAASLIALCVTVTPALSQEDSGLSLMERGALMFMEGIMKEVEPAIEEFSGLAEQMGPALRSFAEQMGPKLGEVLEQVEDWTAYAPPEILPNGDIIIRRKPDLPTETPPMVDL